jgi:bifunctional DNA-binding transcriptional regulator/antitoxin component of YhaV-PrlF toxin-antitoxin module
MTDTVEMERLTEGLPSKSAKMRALAKAGYSRGDISRFLGTSYQFVRNVLVREEERSPSAKLPETDDAPSVGQPKADTNRVRLGSGGQIAIPASILKSLGLSTGEVLIAVVEDGEIRLMTIPTAIRKTQEIVRKYVPADVSLVDELLEDRRREVERESRE